MNKVYEKDENEWELVKYLDADITERLPVIGGWIVRNQLWDQKKDIPMLVSMVFVSDPDHDWDVPCDNSHLPEKISFEFWIKTQKDRDDPIGDLAKDYIDCNTTEKLTANYLHSKRASQQAFDAFDEAQEEYKNLK